ncbi:prevent-host-death family protein [Silvibacterium bohemicum]|uniref:Antitoxin n=1 Tax=Silvibacterium bohemicum TaxID=1577686 RepID=A0A841JU72_9BACT|nr:type II toxin-antitoxin system prevent-host-death family antitoxin [Silvibacterium bohemicum]MBB6142531.1 prevent-host-death family protein [Silvibacterium bohemicum]
MRTVNIGDLKNQLSAYLQYVRNGEEVVIRDRNQPIARILPFHLENAAEEETQLVASGAMRLPERKMNWDSFWSLQKGKVSPEASLKAALESRGDR